MSNPLVSVVIPFYSGVKWLEQALESVKKQTYNNIEILVINDGSKEDFSYLRYKHSESVKFIDKKNGGPASARNKGLDLATGKYVAFLDSDDLWMVEKLEKQIKHMETNKSIWSQHSYEMFWENSSKRKLVNTSKYIGNVYQDCFISFKIQTSCVVILREIISENNIRFSEIKRYGQDSDFYRKIAKDYELHFIDDVLAKFRIRGENAGFQAKIQLNDKASIWEEIYDNEQLLKELPKSIVSAYKLSNRLNNIPLIVQKRITSNKKIVEVVSKISYSLPYSIFKINSIKKGKW